MFSRNKYHSGHVLFQQVISERCDGGVSYYWRYQPLSLHIMLLRSTHVVVHAVYTGVYSVLLPSRFRCASVSFIHQLVDVWAVSSLGLL